MTRPTRERDGGERERFNQTVHTALTPTTSLNQTDRQTDRDNVESRRAGMQVAWEGLGGSIDEICLPKELFGGGAVRSGGMSTELRSRVAGRVYLQNKSIKGARGRARAPS